MRLVAEAWFCSTFRAKALPQFRFGSFLSFYVAIKKKEMNEKQPHTNKK